MLWQLVSGLLGKLHRLLAQREPYANLHAMPPRAGTLIAVAVLALAAVPSLSQPPLIRAVDISSLPSLDCYGTCSPFRGAPGGPPMDALEVLAANGVNTARLRIWNAPSRAQAYANLTGVLGMAARATKAGLKVYIDFHYSDSALAFGMVERAAGVVAQCWP